jgi:7-keto-8-aminopelargonate synthetase-like enzyme
MTERLAARGVNALPIIYPAVPMKAARLRYFITSEHTAEQIIEAVRITAEELKVVNSLGGILRRAPSAV